MQISFRHGHLIEVLNEPTYAFNSSDNSRKYVRETILEPGERPNSVHGVIVDGKPGIAVGAWGGPTTVHEHSAVVVGDALYLAVGNYLACVAIPEASLRWALKVDDATCFGVHHDGSRDALISHGELQISRVTRGGEMIWSSSGGDIFTNGFSLHPGFIEAVDFNDRRYRFAYDTGLAI